APRDATIRLNLARAYVQSGALPKARDAYIELLKLAPATWEAMYELGKAYLSLGDQASAKKTLSELLAKKPDFRARVEVETILSGL
ncbi:MAG TPA: tetratricopeptide repeat protein, partial [Spirochaetales bacterium]|nr:tetratricopeptide repeat protein [Spirochaetales bacterium]